MNRFVEFQPLPQIALAFLIVEVQGPSNFLGEEFPKGEILRPGGLSDLITFIRPQLSCLLWTPKLFRVFAFNYVLPIGIGESREAELLRDAQCLQALHKDTTDDLVIRVPKVHLDDQWDTVFGRRVVALPMALVELPENDRFDDERYDDIQGRNDEEAQDYFEESPAELGELINWGFGFYPPKGRDAFERNTDVPKALGICNSTGLHSGFWIKEVASKRKGDLLPREEDEDDNPW